MSPYARGVAVTLLGVAILSPDGLLIRLIAADTASLLVWRGLFMAAGIAAFLAFRYRRDVSRRLRAIGRPGLLAAVLFALSTIMFVHSIERTTVANTLVIISAAPLLAAVLSSRILGEPIAGRTWAATAGLFGGLAVILAGSLGAASLAGDLFAIGTAATVAGYLVVFRRMRHIDMTPAVGLGGLLAGVACLPFADPFAPSARDFALLFLLGAVIQAGSFALIAAAPRYIPAPDVGLMLLLEAVLGPLWVWIALGEEPAAETFIGGAMVLVAVTGHAAAGLRERRRSAAGRPRATLRAGAPALRAAPVADKICAPSRTSSTEGRGWPEG